MAFSKDNNDTQKKTSSGSRVDIGKDFAQPDFEQWRALVERQLKGASFDEKMVTDTYEGINLQPIYRRENIKDVEFSGSLPGFPPYVRGSRASGYDRESWLVSQSLPYAECEEFNRAFLDDKATGREAMHLVLDRASKLGLDPDQAETGQVGGGGASVFSVADVETALKDIDLQQTYLHIEAGLSAAPVAALVASVAGKRAESLADVKGCIGLDPLGELVESGTIPVSTESMYSEMASLCRWGSENAPAVKTVAVSGSTYHNAGASAVEELAFVLATSVEYVREMLSRGLEIDAICPCMQFTFSVGPVYFMELAKLRASRLLWARVAESFGGDVESRKIAVHAKTSSFNQTSYDPNVNILRSTTEAFSAIAGGADSIEVTPFDGAVRLPDEFSRRIARNTQIILAEESHLDRVVDPGGGSYYIEWLTDQVAQAAWKLFQEVERRGGMFAALKEGFPQKRVGDTSGRRAEGLGKRRDVLIGTNRFPNVSEEPLVATGFDPEEFRKKRARQIDKSGHSAECVEALMGVVDKRSMDSLVNAANHGATLGQMTEAFRIGDSGGISVTPLKTHRAAEGFERVRKACEVLGQRTENLPKVLVVGIGERPKIKPRVDFAVEFFEVGGFDVEAVRDCSSADDAFGRITVSEAGVVVICAQDDDYAGLVPDLAARVKAQDGNTIVVVAGKLPDLEADFRKAGVDHFVYVGADVLEVLTDCATRLGVLS